MWVENKVAGKPSKSEEDMLMLVEISLSKKVAVGGQFLPFVNCQGKPLKGSHSVLLAFQNWSMHQIGKKGER